jgi:hypothetical protein
MQIAALCHTKLARELTAFQVALSSTVELALGRSPDETFRVDVVGELVAEFWKLEEWRSHLEEPSARICDLLLGPPTSQVRLVDRLEEAARLLSVELAARREADTELDTLWTSSTWIRDFMLDGADGPSSLVASLSMVVELLEGHIDAAATNGVRWGTQSALVATLLHFQS